MTDNCEWTINVCARCGVHPSEGMAWHSCRKTGRQTPCPEVTVVLASRLDEALRVARDLADALSTVPLSATSTADARAIHAAFAAFDALEKPC